MFLDPSISVGHLFSPFCWWLNHVESICTFQQHRRHGETCQAAGSDGAQPMRPRRAAYNAGGDATAAATGAREEPGPGREGWNMSYIYIIYIYHVYIYIYDICMYVYIYIIYHI